MVKSPWYDLHGWLGVNSQLSIYLLVCVAAADQQSELRSWSIRVQSGWPATPQCHRHGVTVMCPASVPHRLEQYAIDQRSVHLFLTLRCHRHVVMVMWPASVPNRLEQYAIDQRSVHLFLTLRCHRHGVTVMAPWECCTGQNSIPLTNGVSVWLSPCDGTDVEWFGDVPWKCARTVCHWPTGGSTCFSPYDATDMVWICGDAMWKCAAICLCWWKCQYLYMLST